jgi:predicted Zn-dependent protease
MLVGMLAALLTAPLATGTAASDVNGTGKFWPFHRTPVTVSFGDNLSNQWERYFRKALAQWNQSDVVQGKSVRGSTNSAQCNAKNNTVQVCDSTYGTNTGWLGLTSLNYKGNLITSATVEINDSFFNQQQYNDPVARQHTICHEMGHAFGLDHVTYKSCMNPSDTSVFNYDKPGNRDFKTLDQIYSKANQQAAGAAVAGPSGELELPQAALDPYETVTSQRQPDGTTVVTYVEWAAAAP